MAVIAILAGVCCGLDGVVEIWGLGTGGQGTGGT